MSTRWCLNPFTDAGSHTRRAKRTVKPLADDTGSHIPREIYAPTLHAVAAEFNVSPASILGPSQRQIFTQARREFCVRLNRTGRLSLSDIGRIMGRHHTTVLKLLRSAKEKAAAKERDAISRDARLRKTLIATNWQEETLDPNAPDLSGEWAI